LISLSGPRIDEAAIVEAIDDKACGVRRIMLPSLTE